MASDVVLTPNEQKGGTSVVAKHGIPLLWRTPRKISRVARYLDLKVNLSPSLPGYLRILDFNVIPESIRQTRGPAVGLQAIKEKYFSRIRRASFGVSCISILYEICRARQSRLWLCLSVCLNPFSSPPSPSRRCQCLYLVFLQDYHFLAF